MFAISELAQHSSHPPVGLGKQLAAGSALSRSSCGYFGGRKLALRESSSNLVPQDPLKQHLDSPISKSQFAEHKIKLSLNALNILLLFLVI